MKRASVEVQKFFEGEAPVFRASLMRMIRVVTREGAPSKESIEDLSDVFWQTMSMADLLSRERVLSVGRKLGAEFKEKGTDLMSRVPYDRAIQNIITREPRLAAPTGAPLGDPVFEAIQRMYREEHAFALARSSSLEVTQRVQAAIAEAQALGLTTSQAVEAIRALGGMDKVFGPWTRQYAETVFRTNVNTATSAGAFDQMKDPAVREVIAGLYLAAVGGRSGDGRTRLSHRGMHGTFAPPEHAIWDKRTPPLGYLCRCQVDFISWAEAKRRGWLNSQGDVIPQIPNPSMAAAPGFGSRPVFGVAA